MAVPKAWNIDAEIAAYDAQKDNLEAAHMGQWVVFHAGANMGIYPSFEAAAEDAVARFGADGCLIRQIGEPPVVMPASAAYFQHGTSELQVR